MCVAHPEFFHNRIRNRLEINVNLSFNPHWRFDLITETNRVDCPFSSCCSSIGSDIARSSEPLILPEVIDVHIVEVPQEESEALETDRESLMKSVPRGPLDIRSLAKLKLFIAKVHEAIEAIESDNNSGSVFDSSGDDSDGDDPKSIKQEFAGFGFLFLYNKECQPRIETVSKYWGLQALFS